MTASPIAVRQSPRPTAVRVPVRRILELLLVRLVLFALFQAIIAGILALSGAPDPWAASAAWWPLTASAANLINLGMLAFYLRVDGTSLRSLYLPRRAGLGRDLGIALLTIVLAVPLSVLPNLGLATALFGDPQIALDMLVQPLPTWAAILGVVIFPLTTALAELPTYYGYVQPRLAALTSSRWVIIGVPALFHAIQHATLPLLFDGGFLLWRGLMFLPFALLLSIVLRVRPSVLPYLVAVHFALDMQMALLVLQVSTGA